ncbi:MAG: SpoIVB peptidase [Clostridiales bacterium]|nr:SpoIVB peptidase [Clostridiales bacterium]
MLRQKIKKNGFAAAGLRLFVLMAISACCIFTATAVFIPNNLSVRASEADEISVSLPFVTICADDAVTVYNDQENNSGRSVSYEAQARILGLPVKAVTVNVYDDDLRLYPGGGTFGVRLQTKGVVVVGLSEVTTEDGKASPALDAGLCVGDVITKVNGKEVNTVDEVTKQIAESDGKSVELSVERKDTALTLTLTPAKSTDDGFYRAGLWIRDGTAGIGTVTYVNPEDLSFGGLGHGVCDGDTGEIMPLLDGTVFSVTLSGIVKGENGSPGEIKGYFNAGKTGMLTANKNTGVYGIFANLPECGSEPMEIALSDEIQNGEAKILCSLNGDGICEYAVEIEKLPGSNGEKNMVVHVTDEKLLSLTGGIIQGMSGSPIIQNGKLVGAVTHVLISDPTSGYGIFIENMLQNAE